MFDMCEQTLRLSNSFFIKNDNLQEKAEPYHVSADRIRILFEETPSLIFEVTEKCNYNCVYCGYGENYEQPVLRPLHSSRFMTWDTAKGLIDHYLEIWKHQFGRKIAIGFYGGEALLNFRLIEKVVEYVLENRPQDFSFSWFITTNGSLLHKHIDFFVKYDFHISISIDGDAIANSYRRLQNGEPTFESVTKNIDLIKEHYPEYFKKQVSFQSVINDKARIVDVLQYFKSKYDKSTHVISLYKSNLAKDSIIESLFRDVDEDLKSSYNESLFKQLSIQHPKQNELLDAFMMLSPHYYRSYESFLNRENNQNQRPFTSDTCIPFSNRLFLTAPGYLFPCEKVDFHFPLGHINKEGLQIDFERIAEQFNRLYERLSFLCPQCVHQRNCIHCFFKDGGLDGGKINCSDFKRINYQSIMNMIEIMRDNSSLLSRYLK